MAHNHNQGVVNPLRPYYIPPTIGEPAAEPMTAPGPHAFTQGNATDNYASKARTIFSDMDIDYKEYLTDQSPSVMSTVKEVLDELLWKYMSVFMAQPFEVAKTIMQVRAQDDVGGLEALAVEQAKHKAATNKKIRMYDEDEDTPPPYDSDSDQDEMASFFTAKVPNRPASPSTRGARPRDASPGASTTRTPSKQVPEHQLTMRTPNSVLEVIAQLWQKEGAWGVWKGHNATFIYSVLQSLLENWSRSLLSALFNVPDLGVRGDLDRLVDIASPYPWASLFVAGAAAAITGVILAPLDLVRTRLVLTSVSRGSRRTLSTLRSLPSYLCPAALFIPTVLHSLIHPFFMLSTPLVLRSRFMIDREVSPVAFSIAKFCSSTVALFIKLPLETVLRRGQAAVLSSPQYVAALEKDEEETQMETIVPLGRYNGLFGTMYAIVNEEGSHAAPMTAAAKRKAAAAKKKGDKSVSQVVYRRGQGLNGLWRGWKVSWWGLVGLWTAGVIGGGGDAGEF
ncbi:mitochondrial carrier domain-containing protein [Pseudoneurospora amorphoporcata]|uniref:Mitochondrial carrier domain-containing protein n=1 Tax=Pseudoneurospora amorphoporcata TaxID=241081 RepID=A0AAN6NNN7_9PEZI|nr:mitochondrial carrier domain-containing protein [Pseudoneurospora amorphoporcata]